MIIWLASYPRSGNTLLRTVLRQTMDRCSLPERSEWERMLQEGTPPTEADEVFGEIRPDRTWDEFYQMATASSEVHLVKTHEPPMDDQPAIYVVRDGRKAIYSYLKFHQAHLPHVFRELFELVVGHDFYGDWTSHYRTWNGEASSSPRLLVRYEELRSASPELLRRLADFIGHKAAPREWENPFARLHEQQPDFFREGQADWTRPDEWGEDIEWLFSAFHRDLMMELGYEEAQGVTEESIWTDWHGRTVGRALNLLDQNGAEPWAIRRPEAEASRLRARLLT